MSISPRVLLRIGQLAGTGALILGLLHWVFHLNIIDIHMLFGVSVALTLLIAGIVGIFTRGLRVLGVSAMMLALIVPVFGRTQMLLLIGNFHWLIQVTHLLVGVTAVILIERICKRSILLKQKLITEKEMVSVPQKNHAVFSNNEVRS